MLDSSLCEIFDFNKEGEIASCISRYQPVEVGITRRLLGSTFAALG